MSASTTSSGGIRVLSALGILFVALKLTGVIEWSWWWVTAPFWGPPAILALVIAGFRIHVYRQECNRAPEEKFVREVLKSKRNQR